MLETILYILKVEKKRYNDNNPQKQGVKVAAGNFKFKLD